MLKNFSISVELTFEGLLSILNNLPQTFYLTGSRFFGNNFADSDYDFFVSSTEASPSLFLSLGFKEIPVEGMTDLGYDSSQFNTIMERVIDGKVIQIQIVDNIWAKIRVQDEIKSLFLSQFNAMSKPDRKKLWSLLLNLAGH